MGIPNCLVGETLIVTAGGLMALELILKMAAAGDELPDVLSFDRRNQRWVVRQINGAWVAGRARRLLEVRCEGGQALRCTPHHRFLTREVGWAEARELRCGVSLQGMGRGRVEGVERVMLDVPVPVYDVEVEGTHNFAVTNDGSGMARPVVVHNSGAAPIRLLDSRRDTLTPAGLEITVL
ncbi:MAG: Hint domain-containing protein [Actinomycetota bacterium]|nr:Hint domain-containing protein [Actinomycetota bacterium]